MSENLIGRKIKLTGSGWNADEGYPAHGTVHEIASIDGDGDAAFFVRGGKDFARLPGNPRSGLSPCWSAELVDEAPAPGTAAWLRQAPATTPRSTEEIDAEKAARPRPDLFPVRAIEAGGRAFGYGARKHGGGSTGRGTWRDAGTEQAKVETHVASFTRHWLAWRRGEQVDVPSGLSHLDCAMAQLAIVIDLVEDPPRAIEALEVRAARVKRPGFDGSTSDGGPDSFPGSDYP